MRKCRGVKRGGFAPPPPPRRCRLKDNNAQNAPPSFLPPPPSSLHCSRLRHRRSIVSYAICLPFRSHPISLPPFRTLFRAPPACHCPRPLPAPSPSTAHSARRMPRVNREQHDGGFGALRKRSSTLGGHPPGPAVAPLSVRYPVTPCRIPEDFIPRAFSRSRPATVRQRATEKPITRLPPLRMCIRMLTRATSGRIPHVRTGRILQVRRGGNRQNSERRNHPEARRV